MDIWLLLAIPAIVWIAVMVWLKPRGNRGGMVTRNADGWRAPYWDNGWTAGQNVAGFADLGAAANSGDCGASASNGATGADAGSTCQ